MNRIKELEKLALAAHRNGIGWTAFWERHADAIRAAEKHRNKLHESITTKSNSVEMPRLFGELGQRG